MHTLMQTRREALRKKLAQKALGSLMVSVAENRRYLSGFTGEDGQFDESAGFLFVTADDALLATDSRYLLQAEKEAGDCTIFCYRESPAKALAEIAAKLKIRKMGFESRRVSFKQFDEFRRALEKAHSLVELTPTENIVEELRVVKQQVEIEATRKALAVAESAFMETISLLRPGMTEKEVAWLLEKSMRQAGADSLSFPTIVAAGPNSALPHAVPTDRAIQVGEPILFDWGARVDGYCSDTSRTLILGAASDEFRRVFDTVRQAQQMAIQAIRAGASTKQVDSVARDYIEKNGFKGKFGHALGHGTGLAIHEGPRLSPLRDSALDECALVTVEPGIYVPGWGGVRLENQVVVRKKEAEVLNRLDLEIELSS
ncbi:MAG: aminopeptidase P family protein [Deltaproteobacteria bacterium]|nr:aminopeptidase P family protein [Deltaproteobacteria bacterium]